MNDPDKIAIYIHWPYCKRICPYCDFNVYKGAQNKELLQAIIADLSFWRTLSGPRSITSVHFGGGTPSLLSENDIGLILDQAVKFWNFTENIEIGIEANPGDVNLDKWKDFRAAGINRVSLGVQSLNDHALQFLGRDHDGIAARNSLATTSEVFENVSLDLIFGWADQTENDLKKDLSEVLDYDPKHISTYQLTIEEGTAFERAERRGHSKAVSPDQSAGLYDLIRRELSQAGFEHYEISNFAKPGFRSRHNSNYWLGGDYIGVGPGAHGRLVKNGQRKATIAFAKPSDYIDHVTNQGNGIFEVEKLTSEAWGDEYVLMGLRLKEGVNLKEFYNLAGRPLAHEKLAHLSDQGLIVVSDDYLSVTEKGRPLLDEITRTLLT